MIDRDALRPLYALFCEAAAKPAAHKKGDVWQGPKGGWRTINSAGRNVPAKNPNAAAKPVAAAKKADSPSPAKPKASKAPPKTSEAKLRAEPIPPEPEKPHTEPASHEAMKAIVDIVKDTPVIDLGELRQKMTAKHKGEEFDRAILQLYDDKVIHMSGDADPLSLDPKAGYVKDGEAVFTTVSPRNIGNFKADAGKPVAGESNAPPKAAPKESPPSPAKKAKAPAKPAEKKPEGVHAEILDALKSADPKTLAKVAKMLGIAAPAKAKPSPAKRPAKPGTEGVEKGVEDLVAMAGDRKSTREELQAGLAKLPLASMSKDAAVAMAKKLGKKATTKTQAIDAISRHVLERKEMLHSADS